MGKKSKKAAPPTKEEADLEKYRIYSDVANVEAERLRTLYSQTREQLQNATELHEDTMVERDDMYQYIDAQLLHAARDRQTNETTLRQLQHDAEEERNDMQDRLEKQQHTSNSIIERLTAELADAKRDLEELHEFRGRRPQMEAELTALRQELNAQHEARQREEHQLHVDLWRQREALNVDMLQRVHQAKTNFLCLTSEMLDSTVHRTMLDNQNLSDELALMASRLDKLVHDNMSLTAERAALRRELQLKQEQEAAEVRRSLAHQKQAQAATDQHAAVAQEVELMRSQIAMANARAVAHVRAPIVKAHRHAS